MLNGETIVTNFFFDPPHNKKVIGNSLNLIVVCLKL